MDPKFAVVALALSHPQPVPPATRVPPPPSVQTEVIRPAPRTLGLISDYRPPSLLETNVKRYLSGVNARPRQAPGTPGPLGPGPTPTLERSAPPHARKAPPQHRESAPRGWFGALTKRRGLTTHKKTGIKTSDRAPEFQESRARHGARRPTNRHPATVLIGGPDLDYLCSATFINERDALTAAHCTPAGEKGHMNPRTGELEGGSVALLQLKRGKPVVKERSTHVYVHPHPQVPQTDLAVIEFAPSRARRHAPISTQEIATPNTMTTVGFGPAPNKPPAKNERTIKDVRQARPGSRLECSQGNAEEPILRHGDSGGPLLNKDGKIVGVASANYLHPGFAPPTSTWAPLNGPAARGFFELIERPLN